MKRVTGSKQYRNYMDALEKAEELERHKLAQVTGEALAKGLAEGEKKGEHKKAIETAKNFLKMGLSVEQVAQGTGLTVEEIKKL